MQLETTNCFKMLSNVNSDLTTLSQEQIKEVQKIILDMLHDIIDICDKFNITYHLTGGSALGAIRHNGFIPWDDDADIDMARKDVKKFFSAFEKEYGDKYWIHTPYSNEKFCMPVYQIRRKNTIFQNCYDSSTEQCGICIDIPIIENTPNNYILKKIHGIISLLLGFIVSCRRFYRNRNYLLNLSKGVSNVEKIFLIKIRIGFFASFLPLNIWTKMYDKWNSLCKNENSKFVSVPSGRKHYFGELYERKKFVESVTTNFEDLVVHIPKDYDSYLSHMYGNYMDIPPKEKQEHHIVMKFEINC